MLARTAVLSVLLQITVLKPQSTQLTALLLATGAPLLQPHRVTVPHALQGISAPLQPPFPTTASLARTIQTLAREQQLTVKYAPLVSTQWILQDQSTALYVKPITTVLTQLASRCAQSTPSQLQEAPHSCTAGVSPASSARIPRRSLRLSRLTLQSPASMTQTILSVQPLSLQWPRQQGLA